MYSRVGSEGFLNDDKYICNVFQLYGEGLYIIFLLQLLFCMHIFRFNSHP